MAVSNADYEGAAADPVKLSGVSAGPEPTTVAGGMGPAFNPWADSVAAAAAAMIELVKQTNDFQKGLTGGTTTGSEIPASQARQTEGPTEGNRMAAENVPVMECTVQPENPVAKTEPRSNDKPSELRQNGWEDKTPSQEPAESTFSEGKGGGRDIRNRIDNAQSRFGNQTRHAEDMESLLDQTVTLLESLAEQPALRGYEAMQRRLDTVEQLLGQTANTRG